MTSAIKDVPMPKDEDLKKVSPYMFCKWLSGSRATIQTAQFLNNNDNIPFRVQFLYTKMKHKGTVGFIQFPKKEQAVTSKQIDVIQFMLNMSCEKAIEYLEFIADDEYKELQKAYNLRKGRKR